jgi:hypothetical protein
MGELFKNTYTIDDMLDRMGVKIVLDGTGMTEEEREEAEKNGDTVEIVSDDQKKE